MKKSILSILALIAFIFSACDNGGDVPSVEEPDYKISIAGSSPSYVSARVNVISSNLSKLAYVVLPEGDNQQEFTAEYLFTNCTVVNCSATGKTAINITSLNHDTSYDVYVAGCKSDGTYSTEVLHTVLKTRKVEKFAVISKTYTSLTSYICYPEQLSSSSVVKYATPDIVLFNYRGGDGTEQTWLDAADDKSVITKSAEVNITHSAGESIIPGQPMYLILGEYTGSNGVYTPNFGEANPNGYLYKDVIVSEKPLALSSKPEVEIVVRPSGKGHIKITPTSSIKEFYYIVVSESEYKELVKMMNNNATYMQWFVASKTAQKHFGSKKATSEVTIDTQTLGLQHETKYYLFVTSWDGEKGEKQSFVEKEFNLPAAAPVAADNIVVAHRGGSAEAGKTSNPDNSLASLRYAKRLKCMASETDIYWTKDNQVVVAHADSNIKINGKYPWESTLEELRKNYRLSNGEQLPSLQDYLAEAMTDGSCTKIWLDLKNCKTSSGSGNEYVIKACERACEIITEMEAAPWVEFICTGYEDAKLGYGSKAAADKAGVPFGWMGNKSASDYANRGLTWCNMSKDNFTSSRTVESYLDKGIKLSIHTLDTPELIEQYAKYKDRLKGITTNYPARYMEDLKIK